ncbi:MAG: hypothetical protein D6766_08815 [Verrucomicrobia bacterium]|nr:MAG: hypothetical protein D6766_08815 [Verrucomicrobiota bacterium]
MRHRPPWEKHRPGALAPAGLRSYQCPVRPPRPDPIALVLLAHGSTAHRSALGRIAPLAAALATGSPFHPVKAAFWKQAPRIQEVLADLPSDRACIVPLFLSAGHFAGRVIPQTLGLRMSNGIGMGRAFERDLVYARPLGCHPGLARIAGELGRSVLPPETEPAADTALVLAGHGTPRNRRSRRDVETVAAGVRRLGWFAEVHALFLEEAPRIEDWWRISSRPRVVVIPWTLAEGLHGGEDIPVRLGADPAAVEARLAAKEAPWINPTPLHGREVWCTPSLGAAPGLSRLIRELAMEAAAAARWLEAKEAADGE